MGGLSTTSSISEIYHPRGPGARKTDSPTTEKSTPMSVHSAFVFLSLLQFHKNRSQTNSEMGVRQYSHREAGNGLVASVGQNRKKKMGCLSGCRPACTRVWAGLEGGVWQGRLLTVSLPRLLLCHFLRCRHILG